MVSKPFALLVLGLTLGAALSQATREDAVMLETDRRLQLPEGWVVEGDSPRDTMIELVIAVKQTNLAELEKTLLDVSNPKSENYGKHLSNEQVHALVAPLPSHVQNVMQFLSEHGLQGHAATPNSDFIVTTAKVDIAETMLAPEGYKYQKLVHKATGHTVHRLRSKGYSLPRRVAESVDLVAPTTYVPTIRAARETPKSKPFSAPDGLLNVPQNLRALYGVGNTDIGKAASLQAVTGFIGQTYAESSLAAFYKYFCGANQSFTCGMNNNASAVECKGDACAGSGGVEAMLDIEYITAMGSGIPTQFWGFSGHNPYAPQQEPFLKWLYTVGNTSDAAVPKLFSTSYGEDESEIPLAWSERTNVEFQKCGTRRRVWFGICICRSKRSTSMQARRKRACTLGLPDFSCRTKLCRAVVCVCVCVLCLVYVCVCLCLCLCLCLSLRADRATRKMRGNAV